MGKDGDKKGSGASTQTRDNLKEDHLRLVKDEKIISLQYQETKDLFQKLEEAYTASKGSFSLQRYGQLKDMIKGTASEESINKLRQAIEASKGDRARSKSGLASLVDRAKEFSSDSQETHDQKQEEAKARQPSGKKSGFFNKLKNLTGFSDEPVTDEDVMSSSQLERDNGRKQRSIQHTQSQMTKALAILEKLQHDYQASKSMAPPKRYQELKNLIKEATAEKLA